MVMCFQEDSKIEAFNTARKIVESANKITHGDIIEADMGFPNPINKLHYKVYFDGDLGIDVKRIPGK